MIWSKQFDTLREIPEQFRESYLSIPEAVRLSTIPDTFVRKAIADGELPCFLGGNLKSRMLVRIDHLNKWIQTRTVKIGAAEPLRRQRRMPRKHLQLDGPAMQKFAKALVADYKEQYEAQRAGRG